MAKTPTKAERREATMRAVEAGLERERQAFITATLPARRPAVDADRELVKEIAMDIGKAVVHHIETMYPAMFAAVATTARLSVRNCVHNEIMAALEVNDAEAIRQRLAERKQHRRKISAAYRKVRA